MRDGDVFVVNGQKIWTSLAQVAKFGILIARTDVDTSKYTGISYFIVPMDLPGIEIRPLRNMIGAFERRRVLRGVLHRRGRPGREPHRAAAQRLGHGQGDAGQRAGLPLAATASSGATARPPATSSTWCAPGAALPTRRCASGWSAAFIEGEIMRFHQLRQISAEVNKKPGPDASLRKALKDPHGKKVFNLAKDLMGATGMLAAGADPVWEPWSTGSCSARPSRSAVAPPRSCATSSPSASSGSPTTTTSKLGLTWSEARERDRQGAGRAPSPNGSAERSTPAAQEAKSLA